MVCIFFAGIIDPSFRASVGSIGVVRFDISHGTQNVAESITFFIVGRKVDSHRMVRLLFPSIHENRSRLMHDSLVSVTMTYACIFWIIKK
jgi:hypothetical protein